MLIFTNLTVSSKEPEQHNTVWIRPEGDSFRALIWNNGDWRSVTGINYTKDALYIGRKELRLVFLSENGEVEFVDKDGNSQILSIKNLNIGKSTDSGGEIFNDYTRNEAGDMSHAEGMSTAASGLCAHAEGNSCIAEGMASHAGGSSCIAVGDSSFATGVENKATSEGEFVCGYKAFNNEEMLDSNPRVFAVGCGTEEKNQDVFAVMRNNKVYIIGVGGFDGTNHDSAKSLQEIITELSGS